MKFHQDISTEQHLFTGYGDGYVMIDKARYDYPLIMQPSHIVRWPVEDFASLAESHFEMLNDLSPEVVIFGAGQTLRFLHPRLTNSLTSRGIGVDCMDTPAACRTFNLLCTEGRNVLAVILI